MKNPSYPSTCESSERRLHTFRIILISSLLLVASSINLSAQSKYVKKFKPIADSLSGEYGIPVPIILGIAIMESGAGKSRNCILLNNHFGIEGKNDLLKTKNIKTRYKQYPDALASYVSFCKLMTRKKFYKKLKGNNDHGLWADAISKAGYSEIPEIWKSRLLAIIRQSKLTVSADNKKDISGSNAKKVAVR